MQHIYIFSGLGADERVFQNLDFTGFPVTHIKWITPAPGMPVQVFASRIIGQITAPKPILIGLSFGGIIAIQVAKKIRTEKVIIISSVKNRSEIPWYYKMAGKLRLHRLLPPALLKMSNSLTNRMFGADSAADKTLLKAILQDTDPILLRWAINTIVTWANTTTLPNLTHIHGTADMILPYKFVKCDYSINAGGHLMVLNKAEEMSAILQTILLA